MPYCFDCGHRLTHIRTSPTNWEDCYVDEYRCPRCGKTWIVKDDREVGEKTIHDP